MVVFSVWRFILSSPLFINSLSSPLALRSVDVQRQRMGGCERFIVLLKVVSSSGRHDEEPNGLKKIHRRQMRSPQL
jgi:hypothetical protein